MLSTSSEIDCREAERRIHLDVDGELAPEDSVALEVHLAACESCVRDRVMLEKTRAALRSRAADEDHAPEALVTRIGGDVSRLARREKRSRLFFAAPLALAAVALAVAIFALSSQDAALTREPGVVQRSVDVHTLDVPVDVASPDPVRVAAFLEPRLQARVRVPRLEAAGLSLTGARVVSAAERRAAQLVYEDGLGARVTVLLVPDSEGLLRRAIMGSPPGPNPSTEQVAGFLQQAVVHEAGARLVRNEAGANEVRLLHDGSTLYALVGSLSDDSMKRIATAIAPELPRARVAGR